MLVLYISKAKSFFNQAHNQIGCVKHKVKIKTKVKFYILQMIDLKVGATLVIVRCS